MTVVGVSIYPQGLYREFFSLVDRTGGRELCHPWLGSMDVTSGYGAIRWKEFGEDKQRPHVIAWQLSRGEEVPRDPKTGRRLDVDHVCHSLDLSCPGGRLCLHRRCCNPWHLEVKTAQENIDAADEPRKRGRFRTHFDCGCEITDDNTYLITRKGTRNGNPRSPERRCRTHERIKQGAERQTSSV